MLKEFREIFTKSGKKMAFGAIEDPAGSIEIVVFADILEKWREKFIVDSVLCLKGKIDLTRENPSFKVEDFVDPATLKEKSWKEVHLRFDSAPGAEDELYALRDALFDEPGPCSVYFHVPLGLKPTAAGPAPGSDCEDETLTADSVVHSATGSEASPRSSEAVVKANGQITCSASEETLERLRVVAPVAEAWRD
jgi:DNA polymerase-3 subunit alpha